MRRSSGFRIISGRGGPFQSRGVRNPTSKSPSFALRIPKDLTAQTVHRYDAASTAIACIRHPERASDMETLPESSMRRVFRGPKTGCRPELDEPCALHTATARFRPGVAAQSERGGTRSDLSYGAPPTDTTALLSPRLRRSQIKSVSFEITPMPTKNIARGTPHERREPD